MPSGSGRRPLPTAAKKLRGNAGKRKLNDAEPAAPTSEPKMPAGLSKLAQQEWKDIVPQLLALGVLSAADGKALAAYCMAWSRWMQAESDVEKYGRIVEEPVIDKMTNEQLVFTDASGHKKALVRLKRNPAIGVSHDAMKIMKSFLIEFGLTPAARSRLRIEKPKEADPFETYLKKGASSSPKHVN